MMNELQTLNKQVAIQLGYTIHPWKDSDGQQFYLLVAGGECCDEDYKFLISMGGAYARRKSEDEAWFDCPDFSGDTDQALELWQDIPDEYTPRLVRMLEPRGDCMAKVFKAGILNNETMEQVEYTADEPAEAIANAWLSWHER